MPDNKLTIGISNVYCAPIIKQENGVTTYETPFALPGAVNIKSTISQESEPIYADNKVYHNVQGDSYGEGTLEMVDFSEEFLTKVMGYKKDEKNGLALKGNSQSRSFALLFQVRGDYSQTRLIYYVCTPEKLPEEYNTIKDKAEVKTRELSIKMASNEEGWYSYKIKEADDKETYTNFFKKVYIPKITQV